MVINHYRRVGFLSMALLLGLALLPPMTHRIQVAEAKPLVDLVVVVDAGHGREADEGQPGYGRFMGSCRKYDGVEYCEDQDNLWMSLGARKNLSLNSPAKPKADRYISFHMNVFSKPTASGTTCWYSSIGTASRSRTRSKDYCSTVMGQTKNAYENYNSSPLTWTDGRNRYFDNLTMPQTVVEAGFITHKRPPPISERRRRLAHGIVMWKGDIAMAPEKLITSLQDLEEASRLAAQEGLCKIRLTDGETFILFRAQSTPADEPYYDVTDPEEEQVVLSCLQPGGKTYGPEQARAELERRWAAPGKGGPNGVR